MHNARLFLVGCGFHLGVLDYFFHGKVGEGLGCREDVGVHGVVDNAAVAQEYVARGIVRYVGVVGHEYNGAPLGVELLEEDEHLE